MYNIKEQDNRVIVTLNWGEIYNKKWELYEWLEFILNKHWIDYKVKSREYEDEYWVMLIYEGWNIEYNGFLGNEEQIYEDILEDNNILFSYNN